MRGEIKSMLETGIKAPAFSLPDQNGNVHTLEEYAGKKLILYFYPKDNTPGCTKQACGFAELYPQFMGSDRSGVRSPITTKGRTSRNWRSVSIARGEKV